MNIFTAKVGSQKHMADGSIILMGKDHIKLHGLEVE